MSAMTKSTTTITEFSAAHELDARMVAMVVINSDDLKSLAPDPDGRVIELPWQHVNDRVLDAALLHRTVAGHIDARHRLSNATASAWEHHVAYHVGGQFEPCFFCEAKGVLATPSRRRNGGHWWQRFACASRLLRWRNEAGD